MAESESEHAEVRRLGDLDPDLLFTLAGLGTESLGTAALDEWMLPVVARWGLLFVAESKGEIIGSAQLLRCVDGSEVYMDAFFIRPAHRRQGHASRMLSAVIDRLTDDGFTRLLATLDPDNRAAARLYARTGFREIDYLEDFYGSGRHRVLIASELKRGG